MHGITNSVVAIFFAALTGCAGSTPNVKSGDGGVNDSAADDTKKTECSNVENKFKQIDEAVKGSKGAAAGRALVPALEKMSKEFKESPMKTPGLDKATADLATEADSFVSKMKELNASFEEMEKINKALETWQTKVEASAEAFDNACNKAPKDQCDAVGKRVTTIPHLEGDEFGQYATDLEAFLKSMNDFKVADPGLRDSLKSMLAALGEAIKPMRRLDELAQEPKKLDPAAGQLKSKFNNVREICGLPVRK